LDQLRQRSIINENQFVELCATNRCQSTTLPTSRRVEEEREGKGSGQTQGARWWRSLVDQEVLVTVLKIRRAAAANLETDRWSQQILSAMLVEAWIRMASRTVDDAMLLEASATLTLARAAGDDDSHLLLAAAQTTGWRG
jgi:hypothetical protein